MKNNEETKTDKRPEEADVDRSRDQSVPTIKSKKRAVDRDENKKMKKLSSNAMSSKKISFQGVPKCNPVKMMQHDEEDHHDWNLVKRNH